MPSDKPLQVLNATQIKRALVRIGHEILERNNEGKNLALIGIRARGDILADRLARIIEENEGIKLPVGYMDINFYRDDIHIKLDQPEIRQTEILFDLQDKIVVLIDDVLFTGRTIRAALNQLSDFGRPRAIQLAVLVDRGHRELPIKPDYVGKNLPTGRDDDVIVRLKETDNEDSVSILSKPRRKSKATKKSKKKGAR
ncbi:MAG: bifunctional pyr operon transcriptional regulator/uracil phosphoribosyltransferase PyrR [candidate division Zixibacteria bacterium]|nr:bifunctional pyr operon transcriptional regulator/uracil phosphoribosyltransferase PyrR [candidate division Zixibacteria bacterium]NIW94067.1 bifunctional pyr operon transcriptional regulator/uracil phosphoribosyltransferase PyrR [Phycisphaerae bacterium]NIR65761.1 bifunctional pyr operon transcriptional regulator/uracil phosphoribosyltransferase PyrR [candidate division Zixibacteria bacterium]NIS16293.1 bifunctional pyr operon transcriptional regulator/uracil phosphoribosyltransferase PyrR [